MPVVSISMLEGRDAATKELLCKRLTDAVEHTLKVKREAVSVYMYEIKPENLGRGGVLKSQST